MKQSQAFVGDQAAGAEAAQCWLALQGVDSAVASRRSHQVHVFDAIAVTEMCDAGIADATLPGHLESAEVAQVLQAPPARDRSACHPVLAEIQLLQLRHARQM